MKTIRQEYEPEIKIIEGVLKKIRAINERRLDEIIQAANDIDTNSLTDPLEQFRIPRADLFHVQIFYHDLKERKQQ
jgi:hypothetical protein